MINKHCGIKTIRMQFVKFMVTLSVTSVESNSKQFIGKLL